MDEFAKPTENGKTKLPTAAAQPDSGFQRDAEIVSELTAAARFSPLSLANRFKLPSGLRLQGLYGPCSESRRRPTDPLETMLLEQITVAHHRVLALHAEAAQADSPEMIEVLNAAAAKLTAEIAAAVLGSARVSCADLA